MDFVEAVTGEKNFFNFYEFRLGVMRVGITTQPIVYGMFCSSIFTMIWYMSRTIPIALRRSVVILVATLLSLSSGPWLALACQIGLIGVETVTRGIKNRAKILIGGAVASLTALQLATSHGIWGFVAAYLLINPKSAWYRTLIWERVGGDIARHPIFGMNPANWSRGMGMSDSIDSEWLLIPLVSGYPGLFLMIAACLLSLWLLYRRSDDEVGPDIATLRRAWAFTMVAMWGGMLTVAYFAYMRPQYHLLMALGGVLIRLAQEADVRNPAAAQPVPARRRLKPVIGAPPERRSQR